MSSAPLDKRKLRERAKYAIHQGKAIIGDEMGLGETIQALAAAAHLAAKGQRRFPVVCPASVVPNWLNEIRKHTRLAAFSLHGPAREEEARKWLRRGGIAVTTFNTIDGLALLRGTPTPTSHFSSSTRPTSSRTPTRSARRPSGGAPPIPAASSTGPKRS